MKTIILSAIIATLAIIGIATPVGATGSFSAYFSSNTSISKEGHGYFSVQNGKISFAGNGFLCIGSYYVNGECNSEEVINNPPANSTIRINGLCDKDAATLKANIKGHNVNLIFSSTGICKETNSSVSMNVEKTAATASTPIELESPKSVNAELPKTGGEEALIVAGSTVLATMTYGGIVGARRIFGN